MKLKLKMMTRLGGQVLLFKSVLVPPNSAGNIALCSPFVNILLYEIESYLNLLVKPLRCIGISKTYTRAVYRKLSNMEKPEHYCLDQLIEIKLVV